MLQSTKKRVFASVVGTAMAMSLMLSAHPALAADSIVVRNHRTGARSNNEINFSSNRDFRFRHTDLTDINNDLDLRLNTGNNRANFNTRGGFVRSGDISTDISLRNDGGRHRTNINHWLPNNTFSGFDVSVINDRTGFRSDNNVDIDLDSSTDIRVRHETNIDNDVDIDANTGNNRSSGNTRGGEVRSGDIDVTVDIEN